MVHLLCFMLTEQFYAPEIILAHYAPDWHLLLSWENGRRGELYIPKALGLWKMWGMCGVQGTSERKKLNFPQFLCPCHAILAVSFLSFSLFLSCWQNQWALCSHSLAPCQIFPQRDDIIDCRQVWMFCQHSRAFMIACRCVARNILYPNQKLMKLDCLPNHIFQNRELCKWGGAKVLE